MQGHTASEAKVGAGPGSCHYYLLKQTQSLSHDHRGGLNRAEEKTPSIMGVVMCIQNSLEAI